MLQPPWVCPDEMKDTLQVVCPGWQPPPAQGQACALLLPCSFWESQSRAASLFLLCGSCLNVPLCIFLPSPSVLSPLYPLSQSTTCPHTLVAPWICCLASLQGLELNFLSSQKENAFSSFCLLLEQGVCVPWSRGA